MVWVAAASDSGIIELANQWSEPLELIAEGFSPCVFSL